VLVPKLPPRDDRDYGRAVRGRRRTSSSVPHRPSDRRIDFCGQRPDTAAMGVRTRGLDIKAGAAKLKADRAARAEAEAVIQRWNDRLPRGRDMLWSPTIRAALLAGTPWLPGDRSAHPRPSPACFCWDVGARAAVLLVPRHGANALMAVPSRNCALVHTDATVVISLMTTLVRDALPNTPTDRLRDCRRYLSPAHPWRPDTS
jgi:hypothetical protein